MVAVGRWWDKRSQGAIPLVFGQAAPLDLRLVGRTLLHAVLVGLAAGLVGAAFFGSLEYLQTWLLEGLAGYVPLRAQGETLAVLARHQHVPAVGAGHPAGRRAGSRAGS